MEYVILDNKVKIVDEQTGRTEGRRYERLHQTIEARECEIKPPHKHMPLLPSKTISYVS